MATPNEKPTDPINIMFRQARNPLTGSFASYKKFDDFERACEERSSSVTTKESASDVTGSVPSDTENGWRDTDEDPVSPPPEPLETQYLRVQFCVWTHLEVKPEDLTVKLTDTAFLFKQETYESLEVRQLFKHCDEFAY
jgi:hypothetical protein